MKLKYYLRGFGLGIILTAVIMIIVTHSNRNNLSNAEIINKAESLGMVMSDQSSKTKDTNKGSTIKQQIKDEETNQTTTPEQAEQPVQEFVSVVIQRGEVSDTIAAKLQQAGLVQDAKVFNKYLTDNKFDGNLLTGTFNIPKGATQEEIAKILTTKK
ncbi:MAG: endolytic transglycosylase MltG [Lachnospiraceae bacterium]|nr:endolytic transglycosylase MltG [Lachnospiraceae bacterium]